MHFPLRALQAQLSKIVTVATSEIELEADAKLVGQYVFRNVDGEKFMWGPKPYRYEFHDVETVAEADHVMFLCPLCFEKNGGAAGTHQVFVSLAGRDVPEEAGSIDSSGKPSRWAATGATVDDLVLTPSILLNAERGCGWHGFVGSSGVPAGHAG